MIAEEDIALDLHIEIEIGPKKGIEEDGTIGAIGEAVKSMTIIQQTLRVWFKYLTLTGIKLCETIKILLIELVIW